MPWQFCVLGKEQSNNLTWKNELAAKLGKSMCTFTKHVKVAVEGPYFIGIIMDPEHKKLVHFFMCWTQSIVSKRRESNCLFLDTDLWKETLTLETLSYWHPSGKGCSGYRQSANLSVFSHMAPQTPADSWNDCQEEKTNTQVVVRERWALQREVSGRHHSSVQSGTRGAFTVELTILESGKGNKCIGNGVET